MKSEQREERVEELEEVDEHRLRPQEVELLELEEQEVAQHEQVWLLPDRRPQLRTDPCTSPKELCLEALRKLAPDAVWRPKELEDLHERPCPPFKSSLEEVHHAWTGV